LVVILAAAIVFTVGVIVSPLVIGLIGLNFIQGIIATLAAFFHIPIGLQSFGVLAALAVTLQVILLPVVQSIKTLLGCG
jgi:hypothetical protein